MYVKMINPYAGLPTVKILPKDDTLACALKICAFINNDGALASKLQDARG